MTVQEMIEKLQKFKPTLEVTITDGHAGVAYHTNGSVIALYENDDGGEAVDIGIGGLNISEQ